MSASEHVKEFLVTALPSARSWAARPTAGDLTNLPGHPAVLLFVDEAGAPIQLLTAQQFKRTVISRLSQPDETRRGRADLAEVVRGVRWRQVYCPFEARWRYYRVARVLHPREYRRLVLFGPAWFLHVDWSRPIPELHVTERIWCLRGEFVGPWPTHKSCQQALEGLWDLFDLCRYPEEVRQAPGGTRCAYAEMGRCDAPCDGSAPLERYIGRSRAAWGFAEGGTAAWMQSATERMRQAAAERRYERAGLLRQQLEFAQMWRRRWSPRIRPAGQLSLLLAVPATRRKAWKLFLFRQGDLTDGPLLPDREFVEQTPAWLAEQLQQPPDKLDDAVRMEQTWLTAHFLQHKEARTAVIASLSEAAVPADLPATLQAGLERRRARKAE